MSTLLQELFGRRRTEPQTGFKAAMRKARDPQPSNSAAERERLAKLKAKAGQEQRAALRQRIGGAVKGAAGRAWDAIKQDAANTGRLRKPEPKAKVKPGERPVTPSWAVQRRAAKARASLPDAPASKEFQAAKSKSDAERAALLKSRGVGSKNVYQDQRRQERTPKNDTQQLTPLHQNDEAKVRQLVRRLSPDQANQLGAAIGKIITSLGESFTFKTYLLMENPQQEAASGRALQTLINYANQFKGHRGKLGALLMLAIEELDMQGNQQARDELRRVVEPEFGRYVAKAPRPSQKRKDVIKRGGDQFRTRDEARRYAKQHDRKVVDTRDTPGDRWSVEPRSRKEQKEIEQRRQEKKLQAARRRS